MARPTLFNHRKFRRLVHMLQCPRPHALGYLEMLWASAYESGDPYIGDGSDVELAAEWPGEHGVLLQALVTSGFVDELEGEYYVHDLFDHMPDYVNKRLKREEERRAKGEERKHAYAPRQRKKTAKWRDEAAQCADENRIRQPNSELGGLNPIKAELGAPPAPAPAPAPAPSSSPETLSRAAAGGRGGDGERSGGERAEKKEQRRTEDIPQQGTGPVEMSFPALGGEWHLHRNQLLRLREMYPGLDVVCQLGEAQKWLENKARKPQPVSRMLKFIVNWMNREPADPRPVRQSLTERELDERRLEQQRRQLAELEGPADALPLTEVARLLKERMSSNGTHTPAAEGGGR